MSDDESLDGYCGANPNAAREVMTTRGARYRAAVAQTPDHAEAWNVSHYRSEGSNLARAYIELRQLSKSMWEGPITDEEQERLKAILHSNDI